MNVFLSYSNISHVVCGDCGEIFDADVDRVLEDAVCTTCGSESLLVQVMDPETILHPTIVNAVSYVDHLRPKRELTGKKSRLARFKLAVRNFISVPTFRELFDLNQRKVREAPGSKILRIADFLYSPATVEKIFKQEVADWRVEYYEALNSGRTAKARWICWRHYWALAKAVSLDRLASWFDRVLRRI